MKTLYTLHDFKCNASYPQKIAEGVSVVLNTIDCDSLDKTITIYRGGEYKDVMTDFDLRELGISPVQLEQAVLLLESFNEFIKPFELFIHSLRSDD